MKRVLLWWLACAAWASLPRICRAQSVKGGSVERGLVQWAVRSKDAKPMLVARLPDGRSASVALDKGAWKVDPNPRYRCALIQCYNGTCLFDALNREREGKCDVLVDVETVIFAFVVAGKNGALSIETVDYRIGSWAPLGRSVWSPEGDHMLITRHPAQYPYAPVPELFSRLSEGNLAVIETVDETDAGEKGVRRWPQVFLGWVDAHRFRFGIGGRDYKYRIDYEYDARTGTRTPLGRRGAETVGAPQAEAKETSASQPQSKPPPVNVEGIPGAPTAIGKEDDEATPEKGD